MKKIVTFLNCIVLSSILSAAFSQEVEVKLKPDDTYRNEALVRTMERNLSMVLTEINKAQREDRVLNIVGLPMSGFASKTLSALWSNIHFYCDDDYVVERLWNFSNGTFMARQIPLIITPQGEEFGTGTFQEAVVEFDSKGIISDFRFALDAAVGESMERGGDVADMEHRLMILSYCDRFRTAYNTKDMNFLRQVFSDDALIITGTVVTTKKSDMAPQSSIRYKKQNKDQYLANLQRAFDKNKWIDVRFSEIGSHGEGEPGMSVTRSTENPNIYGVRLRQEWHSSTYSDVGYIFLLWDFTDEVHPVIHVRTWQPKYLGTNQEISEDEIFSMSDFNY